MYSDGFQRRFLFKNQDYHKIKKVCLKNQTLFSDEFFKLDVPGATWARPRKIVPGPMFCVEGLPRADVVQGDHIPDGWLVIAMTDLTKIPLLFNRVVIKHQTFGENYAGIFRFNIWQFGKWVEIVVDDRLPISEDNHGLKHLMGAHSSDKNEFWSSLLEKAYAKLYGTYKGLTDGCYSEAMEYFTGGICERVSILSFSDNLWNIISNSLEKGSFVCVSSSKGPDISSAVVQSGLVEGHVYSLDKTQTITINGESVLLVRLKNFFKKREWKGSSSDPSPQWKSALPNEKKKSGLAIEKAEDFWISLSELTSYFEFVDICHLTRDLYDVSNKRFGWESYSFTGEWKKGATAGGCFQESLYMNTQYRITLTDPDDGENICTLLYSLEQSGKTREKWDAIGATRFMLKGPERLYNKPLSKPYIEDNFPYSVSSSFVEAREIVFRDKWAPGVYVLMPSTYYPDKEGQYLLRVYSEKKLKMEQQDSTSFDLLEKNPQLDMDKKELVQKISFDQTPQSMRLLQRNDLEVSEYFREITKNKSEIDWIDLQTIMNYALTSRKPKMNSRGSVAKVTSRTSNASLVKVFTKEECGNMIAMLDHSQPGKLSLQEFQVLWRRLKYWEDVYLNHSDPTSQMNESELRQALKEVAYNTKNSDVNRMVRKYSSVDGKLNFNDFVMCSIELIRPDIRT